MADEKSDESADEKSGKKFDLKTILIVVLVLGGAGYFFLGSGGGAPADAASTTTTTLPLEELDDGVILNAGTLTVNLADPGSRFARVAFSLVLVDGVDPLAVEMKLPLVLDAALSELADFTADQLKASAGQEELRSILSERAREILNSEEERVVKRVILTDLLVQ